MAAEETAESGQESPGEEAQFRALADHAPVMIWRADTSMGCDFFNRPWLDFTGRTLEEELGHGWAEGVHPEDRERCLATYREAFEARREFSIDYRLRRHDGAWRWLLDKGRPFSVKGNFAGYIGSCIDFTEARQALEEHRKALEERENLLSELHHRVKNNAQATTSFLSLQASRASDAVVAAALRGAAMRVMLATLVQDRMFRVPSDAGVDLGAELEVTARTALEVAGRVGIAFSLTLEDRLTLPVAQATPIALIVNELVVNAARHAFPGGQPGSVTLTMRRAGPGLGEVVVTDDGIGLPPAHPRNTPQGCLGLHLIPRLARQAHASLKLDGGQGVRATLRFACR
ncbi:sensor histidine kinase [Paracraurococcus lichenis]|uniref:histidine kinase n=1 Tax=Paracraurococcus lichenis TaxID=3064888 RepID=A0ABT9DZU4_9PROT|nr:PAS domain S-box protein [Paracraurococcus sp. LOR1-02]MDO9709432.1 PAS domain S-box protein [Paracraurococcus sp. LOR1-02]